MSTRRPGAVRSWSAPATGPQRHTCRPGEGLFIEALDRELARRGLVLPAWEHDLVGMPAARPLGTR